MVAAEVDAAINYAAALDFLERRPRLSRTNASSSLWFDIPLLYVYLATISLQENIPIHLRNKADERARMLVLYTAIMWWGWLDPFLTGTRQNFIAETACRQVAYDLAYQSPLPKSRLPVWQICLI